MKILAIGSSFSQEATMYLHQVLSSCGVENTVVNLYIGGCPLAQADYTPVSECDPTLTADESLLALIRRVVMTVCDHE